MKLSEITVEVRNKALVRLGQIRTEDLDLTAEEVFNNVGSWTLALPPEHPMAPHLQVPGAGIIVTGPNDVLFSGPVTEPCFESSAENPLGMTTFSGVTDDVILRDYLSIPQPSNPNLATQNKAHDKRTGKCEDLLHSYVNANMGPSAPAARRKANLIMGTNGHRGPVISKSPRFPVLGELLSEIAIVANLGFRVVQREDKLVFETYQITNRAETIRLDVRNGQLASQKVSITPPSATRVLVAGQEEGVNRQFVYRDNEVSLAAEESWGRRIERFLDQRQTDVIAELEQAGDEVLAEEGYTAVVAQATPTTDEVTMRFGVDWYLGDRITVVVEDVELTSNVVGMVLKVSAENGLQVGAKIGDPIAYDMEGAFVRRLSKAEARISQIEQNVEPVDWAEFLTDLNNTVSGHTTSLSTLSGTVAGQGASISAINATNASQDSAIAGLNAAVAGKAPINHGVHPVAAGTSVVSTNPTGYCVVWPGVPFSLPMICNGDVASNGGNPQIIQWGAGIEITGLVPNTLARINWVVY